MDSVGDFVVVWHGPRSSEDSDEDIFARRFDANGQAVDSSEFTVNSVTDSRQLSPGVAMNNDGKFIVVWESLDIPELGNKSIWGQLYDGFGVKIGAEVGISDGPSICRWPDVAMDNANGVVAVWTGESTGSVQVRHFKADGNERAAILLGANL